MQIDHFSARIQIAGFDCCALRSLRCGGSRNATAFGVRARVCQTETAKDNEPLTSRHSCPTSATVSLPVLRSLLRAADHPVSHGYSAGSCRIPRPRQPSTDARAAAALPERRWPDNARGASTTGIEAFLLCVSQRSLRLTASQLVEPVELLTRADGDQDILWFKG
jgi:hypothetical protein